MRLVQREGHVYQKNPVEQELAMLVVCAVPDWFCLYHSLIYIVILPDEQELLIL